MKPWMVCESMELRRIARPFRFVEPELINRWRKAQVVQSLATGDWEVSDTASELWVRKRRQKGLESRPWVKRHVRERACRPDSDNHERRGRSHLRRFCRRAASGVGSCLSWVTETVSEDLFSFYSLGASRLGGIFYA